jgi:hypothetical protein
MSLDMSLHRQGKSTTDASTPSQATRDHYFWGSFISDSLVSLILARSPAISTASITVDFPLVDPGMDSIPWNPSELVGPGKAGFRSTTFNRLAMLMMLVNSTLQLFYTRNNPVTAGAVYRQYELYQQWFRALPQSLSTAVDTTPHALYLHMQYHCALISLFRPFLAAHFTEHMGIDPKAICTNAANAISEAFNKHMQVFQGLGICAFQVHCLLTASTIHVVNLKTESGAANLTQACLHLHTLAPTIPWAAGSLHIIQGLAKRWYTEIPNNLQDALEGSNLVLPDFDFSIESGMSAYRTYAEPGAPERMDSFLFSPFPDQQLPLPLPVHQSADILTESEEGENLDEFEGMSFIDNNWSDQFID